MTAVWPLGKVVCFYRLVGSYSMCLYLLHLLLQCPAEIIYAEPCTCLYFKFIEYMGLTGHRMFRIKAFSLELHTKSWFFKGVTSPIMSGLFSRNAEPPCEEAVPDNPTEPTESTSAAAHVATPPRPKRRLPKARSKASSGGAAELGATPKYGGKVFVHFVLR